MKNIPVWDLPTRLFHWLLVAGIVAQYVTAEWLDNAMQWHFYVGYGVLGLIIFRVIWGVVGPRYARFAHFLRGPGAVVSYVRQLPHRNTQHAAGHNPLGGWFVMLMLLLVLTQAISGLFMTDDVFLDGPYRHTVSDSVLDVMSFLHHQGFNALVAIIALHVGAIIFYAVYKKQNLTRTMVSGKAPVSAEGIASSRLLLALAVALISALMVYYIVVVAPPAPDIDALYY